VDFKTETYGYGPGKLEIANEIQQLLCEQVATISRKLDPYECVQYAERNARISELFRRLGCRW
jgi:hypothetical protein